MADQRMASGSREDREAAHRRHRASSGAAIHFAGFSEKRPSRVLPTMTEMTVMLLILAIRRTHDIATFAIAVAYIFRYIPSLASMHARQQRGVLMQRAELFSHGDP